MAIDQRSNQREQTESNADRNQDTAIVLLFPGNESIDASIGTPGKAMDHCKIDHTDSCLVALNRISHRSDNLAAGMESRY